MSDRHISRRGILLGGAAGLAAIPFVPTRTLAADVGHIKIYVDPGHGGSDTGAVGNGLQEKALTLTLALRLNHILAAGYGFQTRLSRTTDVSRSLASRVADANSWGAWVYVSIHINAGGGTGFESYRHTNAPGLTALRHQTLHQNIIAKMRTVAGVTDRGRKLRSDLYVLNATSMSAILTENLFIDNPNDAALLRRSDFLQAVAEGHGAGIRQMFG